MTLTSITGQNHSLYTTVSNHYVANVQTISWLGRSAEREYVQTSKITTYHFF